MDPPEDLTSVDAGRGRDEALLALTAHLTSIIPFSRCPCIRHWKVQLSPFVLRLLALICAILSVGVIWSEVVLSSPWALSPFGQLVKLIGHASPFAIEIMTFVPLLYLSLTTYRSLFKFKLFGDFSLQVRYTCGPCCTMNSIDIVQTFEGEVAVSLGLE